MYKSKISFSVLWYAVIIILGITVYSNSFHVPFQFDDSLYISENPLILNADYFHNPSKLCEKEKLSGEDKNRCSTFRTRFIGLLTFALNYRLHNMKVQGYHAINLAVHLLNAMLVYTLARLALGTLFFADHKTSRTNNLIALFASVVFVAHPIQTQAVTYIAQRFTSLVTMFYLLSIVAYAQSRISVSSMWRVVFYAISLISAVLAMWTKEIAFTLPVMIVLFEFMFFKGEARSRVLHLGPFLMTMVIIPLNLIGLDVPMNHLMSNQGSWKVLTDISRWDYLLTQFTVIVRYIMLIFLPINQNVDYDYQVFNSFFDPAVLFSFLLLSTLSGMGIYVLLRYGKKVSRVRLIAFGIFWFFIALSVESSIIPIADLIVEHRVYLPSVGFFVALSTALFLGIEQLKLRWRWTTKAVFGAAAIIVVMLSVATYSRNKIWQDEVALWEDVVRKSPNNVRGLSNLGLSLHHKKQFDKALNVYDNVIRKDPFNYKVYNNRGMVYSEIGKPDKAISDFATAISIYPNIYEPYQNRGNVFLSMGDLDKAFSDFSKVITINPSSAEAYNSRGVVSERLGDIEAAIEDFSHAISLVPNFFGFYRNRGLAYKNKGDVSNAVKDFTTAIGLNPSDEGLYLFRGAVFFSQGKVDSGMQDFMRACEMGNPEGCEAVKYGLDGNVSVR